LDEDLSSKIANLPTLNKGRLLALWTENFHQNAPPTLRMRSMLPILAYRMQERAYGGLSHTARARLKEIARSLDGAKPAHRGTEAEITSGTKLIRSWRGEVHEVLQTEQGYEYRGQHYGSLSKIAREITGTRWSGPLFFGTKEKKQ
jgi:Protein of unknown function (DUF2924)